MIQNEDKEKPGSRIGDRIKNEDIIKSSTVLSQRKQADGAGGVNQMELEIIWKKGKENIDKNKSLAAMIDDDAGNPD